MVIKSSVNQKDGYQKFDQSKGWLAKVRPIKSMVIKSSTNQKDGYQKFHQSKGWLSKVSYRLISSKMSIEHEKFQTGR